MEARAPAGRRRRISLDGAVGRADLLRLLCAGMAPERAARLTGYLVPPAPAEAPRIEPARTEPEESAPVPATPIPRAEPLHPPCRVPFLLPTRIEYSEPRTGIAPDLKPLTRADLGGEAVQPEPPLPSPDLEDARALLRRWRHERPSRSLDESAIVDRQARLLPIETLPRRRRRRMERRVSLYMDRSAEVAPLVADQDQLIQGFRHALGERNVRFFGLIQGGAELARASRRKSFPSDRGRLHLVVSDLAGARSHDVRAMWKAAAEALVRCGARMRAIVPADLRPAHALLGWPIERWGRALTPVLEIERLADELLVLASPALELGPGLLRALCRLLTGPSDAIAVELAAWNHPDVSRRSIVAIELGEAQRGRRLERFAALADVDLRDRALGTIRSFAEALPRETRLLWELELEAAGLPPGDAVADEKREFLDRLLLNLRPRAVDRGGLRDPLKAFVLDVEAQASPRIWSGPARQELGLALHLADPDRDWTDIQGEIDPARLAALQGVVEEPADVDLVVGSSVRIAPEATPIKRRIRWSPLVRLVIGRPRVVVAHEHGPALSIDLAQQDAGFVILLARHALVEVWGRVHAMIRGKIRREQYETWFRRTALLSLVDGVARIAAPNAFTRDWLARYYVDVLVESVQGVLRLPYRIEFEVDPERTGPVSPAKDFLEALDTPSRVRMLAEYSTLELECLVRPRWAEAMGRDPCGVWVEVDGNGVRFRMRWIPPGRFRMGSPPSEQGRRSDEEQRDVVVASGFWLGETPVTQALWEALGEENPSHFRTPERPVENIDLDMASRFARKLGDRLESVQEDSDEPTSNPWRLPTEEEWEYACRANTTTATYAGDLEILGVNNAPLLDRIAWYGGNSGHEFDLDQGHDSSDWPEMQYKSKKSGTRPVRRKCPNPWGLYDMLGNVWEWCVSGDDEDYTLRGGSGLSGAGRLRAASRRVWPRDVRVAFGFRLARGHALQPSTAAEPQQSGRDAGAGAGRAGGGVGQARSAKRRAR